MNGPGEILPWAASRYGDKLALVTPTGKLTYQQLNTLSDSVAASLLAYGIEPGQPVAILSQNRWEWIVSYHGVLKSGAVVNPLNVMLTDEEIGYVTQNCEAVAIISSAERAANMARLIGQVPTLRQVFSFDEPPAGTIAFNELLRNRSGRAEAPPPSPTSLSTIGYTSGTTGRPKGAMQSHRAVLLNCALVATMHGRTGDDVVLTALPAPHVYGNVVINSTFMVGGTVVLMERFDPGTALELIGRHKATMFEGVPTMYATMLAHPDIGRAQLSSLRKCTVGGQTIAVSTMKEWEHRSGAPLIELWGMTELAGLGTTHALHAPNVHGSIGVALPGVEVRVGSLEDKKVTAPVGEPGELLVRGPIVSLGYYGNPSATAELIDAEGWLHTGDVAYASEDGHFFIVDRLKDIIITGGYNVYPAEIERVIMGHPAVAMVAVGRQMDEIKGELARAYVVLRPGATATESEIIDCCRPHLAVYKLPRSVKFVDDLPKTSTDKIMRKDLGKLDR